MAPRTVRGVRVAIVDPAGFTVPYDHHLARALGACGAAVELVTSRFRFGAAPEPEGYERRELFYPVSSRAFGRSRLRLPLKATEHLAGLARLRRVEHDVLHVQWAPLPELDVRLMPSGRRASSRPTTSCPGAPPIGQSSGGGSTAAMPASCATRSAGATDSYASSSSPSGVSP